MSIGLQIFACQMTTEFTTDRLWRKAVVRCERQRHLLWLQVPGEHRFKHSVIDHRQKDDLVHSDNTRK
jgi:hypothetical protein